MANNIVSYLNEKGVSFAICRLIYVPLYVSNPKSANCLTDITYLTSLDDEDFTTARIKEGIDGIKDKYQRIVAAYIEWRAGKLLNVISFDCETFEIGDIFSINGKDDILNDYSIMEYEYLRYVHPEDGSEYTQWQAFPKVPEVGKTIITFDGEHSDYQIEFDEVIFREDNDGVERTYLRHHYNWGTFAYDVHYWMYAPDEPPRIYGYNVGD